MSAGSIRSAVALVPAANLGRPQQSGSPNLRAASEQGSIDGRLGTCDAWQP